MLTVNFDFEVDRDRQSPVDSQPGDLVITMVKETVNIEKRVSKNEKKVKLVPISH